MKRRLFFSLLLSGLGLLLWPLLFGQKQATPRPERSAIDSLIGQKQFAAAIPLLEAERAKSRQLRQWDDYPYFTIKLAEALNEQDSYGHIDTLLAGAIGDMESAGRGATAANAGLWQWKALNNRRMERYPDAFEAYQTAIRLFEGAHYNGKDLAFCYKNAAQILVRWINYAQADDYLHAALQSDSTRKYEQSILAQLAANAYWQNNLAQASAYFQQAQAKGGSKKQAWADLQLTGALIFTKTGRLGEARALLQTVLAYHDTLPENGEHRIRCLTALADLAVRSSDPAGAEKFFRRAETEGIRYFAGRKSREMAKLYTEWGDFEARNAQNGGALHLYQKAIVQAYPAFDDHNPAVNPALADVPLESWAMRAPARKAALLLSSPAPDAFTRRNAAECYALCFAAAAELRRAYGADEAKLYLAQYNHDIRREALRNGWAIYRAAPPDSAGVLAQLFVLLEDTRAAALRDALQQQRALALSGLPDSLLEREQSLRLRRTEALQAEQEARESRDSARIAAAGLAVFQSERRYADWLAAMENAHPRLARFVREPFRSDPADLCAGLPDSTALLSWFDAGDRYLCLVAQRSGLSAFETPRDTGFDRRLSAFLALLADRPAQANDPGRYFAEARTLGEVLLPAAILLPTRNLIVVPDGRLCYLPFEALLTAPHQGYFGSAPYLVRSHAVRYAWSAVLPTQPASAEAGFLHLAPFTGKGRDGLAPLPDSRRERPEGADVDELFGADATTAAFLRRAPSYGILQLSTHAHAGGATVAGIEFYDRTLPLPEIYAQRLPATLVALSACETGAGEFAEGEGVLSLARAFAYAGAQSLLASHWAVNDRSTAGLFAGFYRKLSQGTTRAEALRQVKLDWLDGPEADARKAPWYWAAFTLSGADGPVTLPASGFNGWWLLGGAAGAAGIAWWWRRKRRVKNR